MIIGDKETIIKEWEKVRDYLRTVATKEERGLSHRRNIMVLSGAVSELMNIVINNMRQSEIQEVSKLMQKANKLVNP